MKSIHHSSPDMSESELSAQIRHVNLQVSFVPYSSDGTYNCISHSQSNLFLFQIHQYHHLLHHLPSYISSRYLNQLLLSSTLPTIKFFRHTTCLQNSSSHYILQTKFSFLEFIYLFLFYLPLNGIDFLSTTLFFHSKKYL